MKRKPPKNDSQIDLFMPAFLDIASRDVNDVMELPFFSLSKKPRFKSIQYKNDTRGIDIIVTGGEPIGLATVWDKDILIWAVSQIRETLDQGQTPNKRIYFHPYQVLKATRRSIGKEHYQRLENALIRLYNTSIHTTIRNNETERKKGFRWIENYETAKDNTTGEAAGMWWIELPDWIYEAALNSSLLLTLDDDYFLLTGGLERWLYLIARKHAGRQENGYTMTVKALFEKCSSTRDYKYFARELRKIVQQDELPGYHLSQWRGKDRVEYINFTRRSNLAFSHPKYEAEMPRQAMKMIS